ncbi:MAG: hypothetical protein AAB671_02200 [Patescibacteria group bacterium]
MLACAAQDKEEGRGSEEVRSDIQKYLFALHHPTVQDVRGWFMALPWNMGVNEVFEAARSKGLGERYAMALKTLHQHRGTDAFRELIGE